MIISRLSYAAVVCFILSTSLFLHADRAMVPSMTPVQKLELGKYYMYDSLDQCEECAFEWFTKALEQEEDAVVKSQACAYLGQIYYLGNKIGKDLYKARQYFMAASDSFDPWARARANGYIGQMFF